MQTFGDRLRAARVARGLTQDELAELLDITKSAVSAWENNREYPAFDKLPRLRGHLGVSLDALICAASSEAPDHHVADVRAMFYGDEVGTLSRDDIRVLRRFRAISERRRKALLVFMDDRKEP